MKWLLQQLFLLFYITFAHNDMVILVMEHCIYGFLLYNFEQIFTRITVSVSIFSRASFCSEEQQRSRSLYCVVESSMETSAYDMAIDASLMDTSTTGDMSSVDTFISSSGRKKKKKKKHKDQLGD